MSLATVFSRAQNALVAPLISVEVHLGNGLPALSVVGLPETAVKESKDRVRAAIANTGYDFPARRITVNLAPADLPKDGGRFDLAIALGILAASGQVPVAPLAHHEFLGELSLGGELRPVRGVLPCALRAREAGRALIVPAGNAEEAGLVARVSAFHATHLLDVCAALNGSAELPKCAAPTGVQAPAVADMADVRAQHQARRALEVAAAGAHSLLLVGPPGAGKSMLASRLPGILPPMSEAEALEAAAVQSISRAGFDAATWAVRPFRSPHHTSSGVALAGGGTHPMPGEISLAHRGVLFLDELPEFDRRVLEVLREPLETGAISISRAAQQAEFPARFQLVAAMNPCPCGYLGDRSGRCHCSPEQITRYRGRISGPLLDRIDIHLTVSRVDQRALLEPDAPAGEPSAAIRDRVTTARRRAIARAGRANALLDTADVTRYCAPGESARPLLASAMERLQLSARAYHRILRVARTIADLDDAEAIGERHISEAVAYRQLDRALG